MSREDSYIMGIKFRNVMVEVLRSEIAPIVEKLNRLDERQSRLEYHLSQPSLPVHFGSGVVFLSGVVKNQESLKFAVFDYFKKC